MEVVFAVHGVGVERMGPHALQDTDESIVTHFELNDQLFARAKLQGVSAVNLWLGANVMVSYPLDEAEAMMKKNSDLAKSNLQLLSADMDFVKEQIITVEVNIARLINYGVVQRRKQAQSSS